MNSVRESYKSIDILAEKFIPTKEPNKGGTFLLSILPNIMYGIGMIAYLIIPPLIPGVTAHGLIIFNVGLIISVYFFAFAAQSIKVIKSNRKRNRR